MYIDRQIKKARWNRREEERKGSGKHPERVKGGKRDQGEDGSRQGKETSDVVCPIAITSFGTLLRPRQRAFRENLLSASRGSDRCELIEIATYGFLPIGRLTGACVSDFITLLFIHLVIK